MARRESREAVDAGPVAELWELPDGWEWRRAREIADVVGGGTPRNASDTANFHANGVPWITPADLSNYDKATIARGARSLSDFGFGNSAARLLPKGTVLISSRAPVGYCAVAANPIATNQGFKSLVLRPGINPHYIRYYVLRSRHYLEANASGTTFKELSGAALSELAFPIPPEEVQDAVVARIDELFSDISDGEDAVASAAAASKTYQQSLLKAAVTGELTADWRRNNASSVSGDTLRESLLESRKKRWLAHRRNRSKNYECPVKPKTEGLPTLPLGWCWVSLDELAWSAQYGTSYKCTASGTGEAVLRIPNLRAGSINLDDLKYANIPLDFPPEDGVLPGDLLIVRTNGSDQLIGRSGMTIDALAAPTFFASYLIRYRLVGDQSLWSWIRLFTESALFRSCVKSSIGSSAGQYNLSMGKLDSFPIAIPPPDERAEVLRAIELGSLPLKLNVNARSLRQSILASAFRGDLVA